MLIDYYVYTSLPFLVWNLNTPLLGHDHDVKWSWITLHITNIDCPVSGFPQKKNENEKHIHTWMSIRF